MKIKTIAVEQFMPHQKREINLPDTGVVVVTGETGTGKSSLFIDPVCWALWGRLSRGQATDDPIMDGTEACKARVDTATHSVVRRKIKKKTEVAWRRVGEQAEEWVTTSKANDSLAAEVGTFDAWYWTHVFSSLDLYFFVDTRDDAQRKVFLERLIGLDARWGDAYTSAKKAADDARDLLEEARRKAVAAQARVEAFQETATTPPVEPPAPLPPEDEVDAAVTEAKRRAHNLRVLQQNHAEVVGGLRAKVRQLSKWVDTMRDGVCPTCGQDVEEDLRATTQDKLARAQASLNKADAVHPEDDGSVAAAEARVRLLRDRIRAWDEYRREVKQQEALDRRLADLEQQYQARAAEVAAMEEEAEEAKTGAQVLAPGGFRSWVVAGALGDITALANRYLAMLSPTIQVTLKGYSELQKGGTNDRISIEIHRAGKGKYGLVSQGERQIIALAVRLAIANLRPDGGTIFIDEAVSAVSRGNTERVAEFINYLAKDRCVVVITHSSVLAKALGGVRIHLEGG